MRFTTTTLGCKVNQCDTTTLSKALISRGHEQVALGSGCDLCIINTCSVTAESARKSRQAISRIKKKEPTAKIAVCGCYSELEPDEVKSLGVDYVSGTGDKKQLAIELEKQGDGGSAFPPVGATVPVARPHRSHVPKKKHNPRPPAFSKKTRAFLKIQDGCNNYCAYCIIPYARGESRSEDPKRLVEEAKELKAQGYKEIVITGIEISSYGKEKQGDRGVAFHEELAQLGQVPQKAAPPSPCFSPCFPDLITAISKATQTIRLRIGSLDPSILTPDLCKKLAEIPTLCNHFHISLQSGCDETLKRMGRKYKTEQVETAIKSLRKEFENCAITADLIVGFPGETDEEFEKTMSFIKKAKFSNIHIFPFSPRERTKAATMQNQIDKATTKDRARKAKELTKQNADEFIETQIGKTTEVLFEKQKNGYSTGHATNYLEVSVKGELEKNTIHKVKLTGVEDGVLNGEKI